MTDVPSWIAAAITAIALVLTYLTYRNRHGKKRLEYVVTTSTQLLPGPLVKDLQVSHKGSVVENPSLTIVRIVNTGDQPIKASDFESNLTVKFDGVHELASATWTATRPPDLRPEIEIDGGRVVHIKPTLINPGDMLQLQVLSAGEAGELRFGGRVAALKVAQRKSLPYPPGTGDEGEMEAVDRFVWFIATPAFILGGGVAIALTGDYSHTARVLILISTGMLGVILYPLNVRYLVRRRRLWRP
jgi:hypothetical protein